MRTTITIAGKTVVVGTSVPIVAGPATPNGPAGGDLEGTYPNPTVKQSSLTVAGKIELATQLEADTGTDATRAMTPATTAGLTLFDGNLSWDVTGLISGGEVTPNVGDSTKFDVAAGVGRVVNWTAPGSPLGPEVTFGPFTAVTLLFPLDFATGLGIDINGDLYQHPGGLPFGPLERRTYIPLQAVLHFDQVNVFGATTDTTPAYDFSQGLMDYIIALGPENVGNLLAPNGANLKLDKAVGATVLPFINFRNDPRSPATLPSAAGAEIIFGTSFRDGSGGFNNPFPFTDVDPGFYDDGSGVLQAVSSNKWTIKRCVFTGITGFYALIYGQVVYNSKSDAVAGIASEQVISDPRSQGVVVMFLVTRGNATDLSDEGQAGFLEAMGAGASGSNVTSIFGRGGTVSAVLGDYSASLVTNDSGVTGATVADALDTLQGLIDGFHP